MPHMTEKQEEEICDLIKNWPLDAKLSWPSIVEVVKKRFGLKFTRQTLWSHECVAIAYRTRKELIAQNKNRKYSKKSMSLKTALETVVKLEKQISLLETENNMLHSQFARWAHNAQNTGLSFDLLNKPLPTK